MKNTSLILLALIISYSTAHAGEKGGNGGTVLVCTDHVGLADFEEINLRPGLKGKLTITESGEPVTVQVEKALAKITNRYPFLKQTIEEEWASIQNRIIKINGEYEWNVTQDVGLFPKPKDCTLKNAVLYIDNGPIEVQMSLLNSLSQTHQAGLWVHEILWKLSRTRSLQTTTLPTRRTVAMLFADNPDNEILYSLINEFIIRTNKEDFFSYTWDEKLNNDQYYFDVDLIAFNSQIKQAYCGLTINDKKSYCWEKDTTERMLSRFKPGDYFQFFVRILVNNYSDFNDSKKIGSFRILKNEDPKSHKSRRRFQSIIQYLGTLTLQTKPPQVFEEEKYFVSITSPKMNPYLKGIL